MNKMFGICVLDLCVCVCVDQGLEEIRQCSCMQLLSIDDFSDELWMMEKYVYR